jgi:hypothetical protein
MSTVEHLQINEAVNFSGESPGDTVTAAGSNLRL